MTPLRQRMIEDMQIRNFSPRTIECYIDHVACFARHFGRSPEKLGLEEIRKYQVYLVQEKQASWCSFNQAVGVLRFLYRVTLPRPWPVSMIPFPKRPKRLPVVLSPEEVQQLLGCVKPWKQRLVLTLLYAAGLRLEEGLHLRVADIDSARMLLRVACGEVQVAYNSRRNRHCPTCGGPARARWLERLRQDILPVPYFHLVLTLPRELSRLALANRQAVYGLLFQSAWLALRELAAEPRHLGARAGALFVRRFPLHVLPRGLVRVRYYGLFANSQRNRLLPRWRELLGVTPPTGESAGTQAVETPAPAEARPCPPVAAASCSRSALGPDHLAGS
jgi:hypothetical protein